MLTIILTTYNRPDHLTRLLNYFGRLGLKYPIIVGDASEPMHLDRNRKAVSHASKELEVRHLVWERWVHNDEVIWGCLNASDTPYVMNAADDDFQVPRSLESACNFMENNPSYSAAQGKQIAFTTSTDGAYAPSLKISPMTMVDFTVASDSARGRIEERMSQNTRFTAPKTAYSVMRTTEAVRILGEVLALGLDDSNREGTMAQMLLLSGSIKLMDTLYLARQEHNSNNVVRAHGSYAPILTQPSAGEPYAAMEDRRADEKRSNRPEFFDHLIDPLFPEKFRRISTCLTRELSRQDGIDFDEAHKIIKHWHWYFLAKNLMPKFYEETNYRHPTDVVNSRSVSMRMRRLAKRIPGSRQTLQRLRRASGGEISLDGLLGFDSTSRSDLKSIYNSVTTPPA